MTEPTKDKEVKDVKDDSKAEEKDKAVEVAPVLTVEDGEWLLVE